MLGCLTRTRVQPNPNPSPNFNPNPSPNFKVLLVLRVSTDERNKAA